MRERHQRSIVKALSWRVISVICTWLIAWAVTGSFRIGVSIGLFDCAVKLLAYYAHERSWQRVRWGFMEEEISSEGGGI